MRISRNQIGYSAALAMACTAVTLVGRSTAMAADVNAVSNGDWSTAGTWNPNEPTTTDNAFVNGGFTVGITQTGEVAQRLDVGTSSGGSGTVSMSGGDLTISGGALPSVRVGQAAGSIGTFNMSAGAININGGSGGGFAVGDFMVGDVGTGTMNQSGGVVTISDEINMGIGPNSSGTINLTGGTMTTGFLGGANIPGVPAAGTGRSAVIGFGGGSVATMNVNTAGTLTIRFDMLPGLGDNSTGNINIGPGGTVNTNFTFASGSGSGTSTITQTGGSYNHLQGAVIGQNGKSTYNHSGGTYSGVFLTIADNGIGTYNLSGNAVDNISGEFLMGVLVNGNGTVNQSGGTANANRMVAGRDSIGVYNQSGGTLNVAQVFLGDYDSSDGTHRISGGTVAVSGNYSVGGALASNAPADADRTGTQGQAIGAVGHLIVSGHGATINIGGKFLANPADNTRTDGPDNGATLKFEILDAGGTSLVNVAGAGDLDGAIVDMALVGFVPAVGQTFDLIAAGGGFGSTGTGTTQNTGTGEGYTLMAGDEANWQLSVVSGQTAGGEILRATYVPEPTTLAACGLASVLLRRRRA